MKKFSILILCFSVFGKIYSQTESQKAENFFKNASVVTFNEDYQPSDYIGSIVYFKNNDKSNVRVLKITKPNDSTIVRKKIDDILYQKMHTSSEVASASFLGIFKTKVKTQNLLEVILLRDYALEAESFLINPKNFKTVTEFARPLKNAGYTVEFVWKVNVNKLTSRLFKEGDIEAGFNYKVEATGKIYNKTEDFTKKTLITLQTIDVSLFIKETKDVFNKIVDGKDVNLEGKFEKLQKGDIDKLKIDPKIDFQKASELKSLIKQ